MRIRRLHLWLLVAAVSATVLGLACFPSSSDQCAPPYSHPTFRLAVRAPEGLYLPSQLLITVKYGSGEEVFDAEHPSENPLILFCKRVEDGGVADVSEEADGAASGSSLEQVVCDLWTDGPATVTIKAQGYPNLVRDLSPDTDECGLKLTDATIRLEEGD